MPGNLGVNIFGRVAEINVQDLGHKKQGIAEATGRILEAKPEATSHVGTRIPTRPPTPSPPIKSLGFEGFDSSRLLILKGGKFHVRLIL